MNTQRILKTEKQVLQYINELKGVAFLGSLSHSKADFETQKENTLRAILWIKNNLFVGGVLKSYYEAEYKKDKTKNFRERDITHLLEDKIQEFEPYPHFELGFNFSINNELIISINIVDDIDKIRKISFDLLYTPEQQRIWEKLKFNGKIRRTNGKLKYHDRQKRDDLVYWYGEFLRRGNKKQAYAVRDVLLSNYAFGKDTDGYSGQPYKRKIYVDKDRKFDGNNDKETLYTIDKAYFDKVEKEIDKELNKKTSTKKTDTDILLEVIKHIKEEFLFLNKAIQAYDLRYEKGTDTIEDNDSIERILSNHIYDVIRFRNLSKKYEVNSKAHYYFAFNEDKAVVVKIHYGEDKKIDFILEDIYDEQLELERKKLTETTVRAFLQDTPLSKPKYVFSFGENGKEVNAFLSGDTKDLYISFYDSYGKFISNNQVPNAKLVYFIDNINQYYRGKEKVNPNLIAFLKKPILSQKEKTSTSEPNELEALDKRKQMLSEKVKSLSAKKKKLYSNMDITSPKSKAEKELEQEISTIYSEINSIVGQKRKINSSTSEPKKKMKKDYSEGEKQGREILNAYFTPLEICEQMWELAKVHGYNGGRVLEPACGTGNMLVHAPDQSKCVGLETSERFFLEAKERLPKATFHNIYFEQLFLQPDRFTDYYKGKERTWLEGYPFDLVIGNPPYGKFTGKYASYFSRKRKGNVPMKQYELFFVYKALELLKKGGLVVYLTTQNLLSTGFNAYKEQKNAVLTEADLVYSCRIGSVFEKTKVPVDILILQKK
ncbi:Eco57I restriction-modification methylase domain-containing protein [Bernardetia sp. OM2101]|uniref:Eco57I restriction-modification methylase domain-containing protein n=1 Tax=Bernardetia sp. OM2101 TaxID=3344876 RepID=UPI0035D00A5B